MNNFKTVNINRTNEEIELNSTNTINLQEEQKGEEKKEEIPCEYDARILWKTVQEISNTIDKWKILFFITLFLLFIYWIFFINKSYSIEDYRKINFEKWQKSLQISKDKLLEIKKELFIIRENIELANRCVDLNSQPALAFDCEYKE